MSQGETWISLAIQIPLVGLFIYFSILLIDKFLKSIESIVKTFGATVDSITKSFVESTDSRDQAWRDFFNSQREQNNAAIAHMAERFSTEIRVIGKEVAEIRGLKS
jgi:hypothetical protein